jgi:hypothetical protein
LTPLSIKAIILGPFVFVDGFAGPYTRRHETIHWRQQIELLIIGFYILYVLSWLWMLARHRSWRKAYLAIPFEVEARDNQYNRFYLDHRPAFAWLRKGQQ